ncbi:hypothetical protein L6R53_33760, partial [Myxococcota bacterium]|nr:hypothetical protein [Myxococcota bacterium]
TLATALVAVLAMAAYTSFISFWPYNLAPTLRHYTYGLAEAGVGDAYLNSLRLAVLTDRRADNARNVQMIVIDAAGRSLATGRLPVPLALELAAAIRRAATAASRTAPAAQPQAARPRPAQRAPLILVAVKGGAA